MISKQQSPEKGFDIKRALIYFLIAYVMVTILATAISVLYGMVYPSPQTEGLGVSLLKVPSFTATVPYHVLIMLLIWPAFAWVYFRKRQRQNRDRELKEALRLSVFWLAAAVVVDFVCFVLIKHAWSFTPYEFYVEYQPWISLIYISIFLSPLIYLGLLRLRSTKIDAQT
jgi:small-conductance mechanosensitive channel